MVVVQVIWSGYAIHFDHYNAYSPDIAAADFLKPLVERGSTVAVTYVDDGESDNQAYFAIGILPYFDHNIYVNQPDSFWWWSNKNPTEALFNSTLPSNPRIVLVEMKPRPPSNSLDMGGPRVAALYHAGYKLTNLFCGTMPRQMGHAMTTCHAVFRHSEAPQ
jgi:hypothetical protein